MEDQIILPQDPFPSVLPTPPFQTPSVDTPSLESPITPPLPLPLVLPASSDVSDPPLFALIHRTITACDHLSTQDRLVLRAVLSNIPADNTLVRRMIALDPSQLQVLAQVFEAGLIAARNFGGRPSSSAPTPSAGIKRPSPSPNPGDEAGSSSSSKRSKLDHQPAESVPPPVPSFPASPTPNPVPNNPPPSPPPTPVELLFRALGISGGVPNLRPLATGAARSSSRFGRRASLADTCLARQNNTCPITGRTVELFQLETAHLIPHSIAALETADDLPYWRFLRLFLGPVLSDHIFNLVAGSNSFRSTNGVAMDPTLHGSLFDRGIFWLLPQLPDDFDHGFTSYDVEFKWRADPRFLSTMTSTIPRLPEEQLADSSVAYKHLDTARTLTSGDRFRLFTPDTERYPLPHPLLLSLHARLWEMIAGSGLSETAKLRLTNAPAVAPRGRGMPRGSGGGGSRGLSRQTRGSGPRRDSENTSRAGSGSGTPSRRGSAIAGGAADDSAPGGVTQATTTQETNQTADTMDTAYLDFKLRQLAASTDPHEPEGKHQDAVTRELHAFHQRMWEMGYLDTDGDEESEWEEEENDWGDEGDDRREPSPGLLRDFEQVRRYQYGLGVVG